MQRRIVPMQRLRSRELARGTVGDGAAAWEIVREHLVWRRGVTAWKRKSSASMEFSRCGRAWNDLQTRKGATLELLRGWGGGEGGEAGE